jgi:hypothetical protein
LIQPGGNQLTDPVSPIYLASLVGRQVDVSVKRRARSTPLTLFDALFGRRDNMFRRRVTASILVRRQLLQNKGSTLEERLVSQPAPAPSAAPSENAASSSTSAATPAAANPQSPPIAPILTLSPGTAKINDLPAVPLE